MKPSSPSPSLVSNKPAAAAPSVLSPSFSAASLPNCSLEILEDGTGLATVKIPEDVMKRLSRRADRRDVAEYCWTEVFRPNLYSNVY